MFLVTGTNIIPQSLLNLKTYQSHRYASHQADGRTKSQRKLSGLLINNPLSKPLLWHYMAEAATPVRSSAWAERTD
jgi:hypothetical protein